MKSTTQNAKIEAITEKTLIIGIDVGSETHYARAINWRGYEVSRKPLEFSNTEEGFEMLRISSLTIKQESTETVIGKEKRIHYISNLP